MMPPSSSYSTKGQKERRNVIFFQAKNDYFKGIYDRFPQVIKIKLFSTNDDAPLLFLIYLRAKREVTERETQCHILLY